MGNVECDQVSLVCPLSEKRIQTPVRVAVDLTLGPFDKTNILSNPSSMLIPNALCND